MSRSCPFCGEALRWLTGVEQSGRARCGNARETDRFVCGGCDREFRHSVSERFSGNLESWWVREDDGWQKLDETGWPR